MSRLSSAPTEHESSGDPDGVPSPAEPGWVDRNQLPAGWGARIVAAPIVAYRRWISPALPARCRFYPSCSAYALEAVTIHGPVRGIALAIWRLLRCHPFHPGGYDPVPPARTHRAGASRTGAAT